MGGGDTIGDRKKIEVEAYNFETKEIGQRG
mgnify:CR=1 FL=1